MRYVLEIYFPILPDMLFENYPFEQRKLVLGEIRQLLRQNIFDKKDHIIEVNAGLAVIKKAPFEKAQNIFRHYLWHHVEDALKFTVNLKIDLSLFPVTIHKGNEVTHVTDEKELMTMLPYSLADQIGNRIFELLIISQIARPGSLKLREGIIWINGNRHLETVPEIMNCREAMELRVKTGYPHVAFLKLTDLYRWATEKGVLFSKLPENSYQYVLNYLSYVQGDSTQIHSVLYKMMALEKLYTQGVNQIAAQLNEKIQVFLGEMNSYKSQIKKMYDIRSRYFHGSIPLPPMHKADHFEELPAFQHELDEANDLSLLLIIATLQKMYKENLVDIRFLTTYKP
jgi:hypothetical protein